MLPLERVVITDDRIELWLRKCGNVIASGVKRGRLDKPDALLTWSVLDAIRSRVEIMSAVPAQARAAPVPAIVSAVRLEDLA